MTTHSEPQYVLTSNGPVQTYDVPPTPAGSAAATTPVYQQVAPLTAQEEAAELIATPMATGDYDEFDLYDQVEYGHNMSEEYLAKGEIDYEDIKSSSFDMRLAQVALQIATDLLRELRKTKYDTEFAYRQAYNRAILRTVQPTEGLRKAAAEIMTERECKQYEEAKREFEDMMAKIQAIRSAIELFRTVVVNHRALIN